MTVLDLVGRSLLDGAGMLWATLWALVVGCTLSGAVQAFVSRDRIRRALGDHRPATLARAGLLGAVSSSCSYAAAALARTLFAGGADFTTSQVFLFASTNLVLELGIVLWRLIGWQFAAAELVGGVVMMGLLALVLPRVVGTGEVDRARRRAAAAGDRPGPADPVAGGTSAQRAPGRHGARTLAGWSDAAGYTVGDLTMLRREIALGFLVAGFADTAVPVRFYSALFMTGHGLASGVENVLLAPLLAVLSFVCSVGNVPLAAALWSGRATFGGVIAFVFADLVTLPLLLVYRRYYGTRLTVKLLAVFWAVISLAGLATDYLFRAAGLAPTVSTSSHGSVGRHAFGSVPTGVLDLLAVATLAGLYWLYRHRTRLGGGAGYARDPVCGMQVEVAHAPAVASQRGRSLYFCSDGCRERFAARPGVDRLSGHPYN